LAVAVVTAAADADGELGLRRWSESCRNEKDGRGEDGFDSAHF
jgi:hypothetical protein